MSQKIEITEDIINQMEEMESGLYEKEVEPETIKEKPIKEVKVFLQDIPEFNIGWIKLNKELLPSKGLFYEKDIIIELTPATTQHIKDFTSLSEDDSYKTNEKINAILSTCLRISKGSRRFTSKDILEIDKVWLLLAIRDLTFSKISNKLINPSACPKCTSPANVEIFSYNSTFFEFNEELMNYYDEEERCFMFDITETGETLKLKPPTISVSSKVDSYYEKYSNIKKIDRNFLNEIQYIDLDWYNIDVQTLDKTIVDSFGWSVYKITLLKKFINDFKSQIKMKSFGYCESCGAEGVSTKFYFRGGLLSIFTIQNIYSYVRKYNV
jgi:hypothetical protein